MSVNQPVEADSANLDRILLLQSAMAAAPDLLELGEEFCRSCQALPGVGDVSFYHRQQFVTGSARFDEPVRGTVQRIELGSVSGALGLILLSIVDAEAFKPHAPHLQASTRLFSSMLENYDRCQESMELNVALSSRLEDRSERLQQSERRFRLLVESAPEAILLVDPESMLFKEVNAQAVKLFGWSREDLLRMGPLALSPPEQPGGGDSARSSMMYIDGALRGDFQVFEWTFKDLEGAPVLTEVRLVRTDVGGRSLLRASVTDISERRRLEEQLLQSQKMEAVGQLSGGLAHDFNNLLVAIVGNTELLKLDLDEDHPGQRMLTEIMRASRRGAELTQHLLAFSRKHVLRPQNIILRDLVKELLGFLGRTLGEDIEVSTRTELDLWSCRADPVQMENCLLNLAINSRDAMPKGGKITIETRNETFKPGERAAQLGLEPGEYVSLALTDNGTGIAPEHLAKVLDPFFTTKQEGKGTGLGLSMVYGFAKQSKGAIEISSRPGVGTTVRLFLPRGSSQEALAGATTPTLGGGGSEILLLVEDDFAVRTTVEFLLVRLGYRVRSAEDAPSALKVLEEMPEVDLLLSDIRLPGGVHGPELAGMIRALRPQIKLLFMSGYVGDENPFDRDFKDTTILAKPFSQNDLARELRRALDREVTVND